MYVSACSPTRRMRLRADCSFTAGEAPEQSRTLMHTIRKCCTRPKPAMRVWHLRASRYVRRCCASSLATSGPRRLGFLSSCTASTRRRFRANLQAHVTTMAPLGFNVHALRLLADRDVISLIGPPEALEARIRELRAFFHPWGDELAHGLAHTRITHACLPAVAQDQQPGLSARLATGQAAVFTAAQSCARWAPRLELGHA